MRLLWALHQVNVTIVRLKCEDLSEDKEREGKCVSADRQRDAADSNRSQAKGSLRTLAVSGKILKLDVLTW